VSDRYFHDLVSATFDADGATGPPTRLLLICTTPRTAGHAVCEAMRRRGWGVPTEYFSPDFTLALQNRWLGPTSGFEQATARAGEFGDALRARRSVNGIFAAKVFAHDLGFAHRALTIEDSSTLYVRLYREDVVSQTISLAATLLTRRPFDGGYEAKALPAIGPLDERVMLNLLQFIRRQDDLWQRFLSQKPQASVAELSMGAFLADPAGALDRLAARLELPNIRTDPGPLSGQGPYTADRELKQRLRARFGAVLERASREAGL
jgi:LPS sulfotransferase NodH